jgi:predicted aspartyl protease
MVWATEPRKNKSHWKATRLKSSFKFGVAIAIALAMTSEAQTPDDLHTLFEAGKVFALRDAVQHTDAPAFYRGAVAASTNHIEEAARTLHEVIHASPDSEDAYDAHDLLANVYQRNGLYREALLELQAAIQQRPQAKELQNVRPMFEALARSGDMTVIGLRPTRLRGLHDRRLPFRLNGKRDSLAFDTGAAVSFISDREAAYLDLTAEAVSTKIRDSSGNGVSGFRVAIAKDLVIGGLHLQNVPFLVIPDTHEPFREFGPKEGHRGLIGLPVLLAMQSIRWQPRGDFEFDFPSPKTDETSNLLFHETNPVAQVKADGRNLDFTLDTGATTTDLNPVFAKEFPALIASGQEETNKITGVGGTQYYDSVLLPSVSLIIGGKVVNLAPAHVSTTQGIGGTRMWAGNLGNDLLNQAHSITIDFRVMSLKLE